MEQVTEVEIYGSTGFLTNGVLQVVRQFIAENWQTVALNERITDPSLPDYIDFIRIWSTNTSLKRLSSFNDVTDYRYVHLNDTTSSETINEGDNEGSTVATTNWELPSKDFDGLWESLFFSDALKLQLLNYSRVSMQLAQNGVDPNIVCCNRLVLLHGPPGTGKTSLCKALAQKLSIRLSETYLSSHLVEVNCHSLFSKWFSESGKLVSSLFATIRSYAQNSDILVIVLIDEVESLTSARQASINNSEPSDAVRVVNAVLTQLDALRSFSNVFVLATSNLTEAIDPAFADRVDLIQFIDLPNAAEIALILESCFRELERVKVFESGSLSDIDTGGLAQRCLGLSGRAVRKLPLIALSQSHKSVTQSQHFLKLLNEAVSKVQANKKAFELKAAK